ncbi:hypothetical protein NL676_024692 [Syzygium grande]|nr:hypothetical protein NL676_024692 [Syzygium grande]
MKHENGTAGNSTIVVRIIACFQPLHDCQAEYFRHLLKPVTNLLWVTDPTRSLDGRIFWGLEFTAFQYAIAYFRSIICSICSGA